MPVTLNRYKTDAPGIYIGRGTAWGNPFIANERTDQARDRVCDQFEQYAKWRLNMEPDWLDRLRGHDLVCSCAPKRCHGDTLVRLANEEDL